MPKTIAITPSWYWPAGTIRCLGVPPYSINELCVLRHARQRGGEAAVVDERGLLTFEDLYAEVGRQAASCGPAVTLSVAHTPTREDVVALLAALTAEASVSLAPETPPAEQPATVTIKGTDGPVTHNERSLLAGAISMGAFLDAQPGEPWLSTLPLSSWQGLMGMLLPLYLGSPLVLPKQGADADELLGLIPRHQVRYAVSELTAFAQACRDAKRSAKDARRMLAAALLAVDGPFDADPRRRVSKALECPALTFWGTPETGPVFASHPSWYIDESVGLPMTNAHVVPSDPRTGQPIAALWELVEMAEVTVFSPGLARSLREHPGRFAGNRLRTGMMASSDANGMIYLLGK